jgi:hypothetical protein
MDRNRSERSLASGCARMTACIEICGAEQRVLSEGGRLLRMIADELEGASLRNLRVEYDRTMGHLIEPGTHPLEVLAPGADSPEEATLWRLALRAGTNADAASASTCHGSRPG